MVFYKKGAQGEAKVILAKDTLKAKWLKKPFCSLQTNKKVQLSEITGWKYIPSIHFDMLKIYLKHHKDIRLEKYDDLKLKSEPDDFYIIPERFRTTGY